MKATINAKKLENWITALNAADTEGIVTTTPTGLHTCIKEPGNVLLVNTVLGADSFENYDHQEVEDIGFDLQRISEAVSIAASDESVTLQYPGEQGPMSLRLETERSTVELATIMTETIREKAKVGDLSFDVDVTVPVSSLKEGHKACTFATENVIELEASPETDKVTFKGVGDNARITQDILQDDAAKWEVSGLVNQAMYDEGYFTTALGGIPSSTDTVRLQFSERFPMKLTFDIGDSTACYLIAPRMPSKGGAA